MILAVFVFPVSGVSYGGESGDDNYVTSGWQIWIYVPEFLYFGES